MVKIRRFMKATATMAALSVIISGCGHAESFSVYDVPTVATTEATTEEVSTTATTEATTEKSKTEDKDKDKDEATSSDATNKDASNDSSDDKTSDDTSKETSDDHTYQYDPSEVKLDPQGEPLSDAQDFVLLTDEIPDAVLEIRYYTDYNFVGTRVNGYEEPVALMTKEAASALKEVNEDLKAQGYRIKIYDAYRPQTAVNHFVSWASDSADTKMKEYFYPDLDKSVLIPQGYIGQHSGHSRGSTVDLTLVFDETGEEVDMGGTFDFFGTVSHPDYTGITEEQYANRMILRNAMTAHGFKPLSTEWWHFSLQSEPYPNTYFDFPVNSDSVGR